MSDVDDQDKKTAADAQKNNKEYTDKQQPTKSPRHVQYNRRRSKKHKALINCEKSWDEYVKFMNLSIPKKNYHESPHIVICRSFNLIRKKIHYSEKCFHY